MSKECIKCKNKLDFGDEYVCCTDCSDPYLLDKNSKLGYCKTESDLVMQLKPLGAFSSICSFSILCFLIPNNKSYYKYVLPYRNFQMDRWSMDGLFFTM